MMREVVLRAVLAPWMLLAGLLLGIWGAFVVVFGRRTQRMEVGRAQSRLLNACWDGDGATTFSAASYAGVLLGKPLAAFRVALVDGLNREPGHCRGAFEWHRRHDLIGANGEKGQDR